MPDAFTIIFFSLLSLTAMSFSLMIIFHFAFFLVFFFFFRSFIFHTDFSMPAHRLRLISPLMPDYARPPAFSPQHAFLLSRRLLLIRFHACRLCPCSHAVAFALIMMTRRC